MDKKNEKNIINNIKSIDSSFDKESLYFSDHHMSHATAFIRLCIKNLQFYVLIQLENGLHQVLG